MRIRHTVEAPDYDEIKRKVLDSRWIPFAAGAIAVIVTVRVCNSHQPITIINQ